MSEWRNDPPQKLPRHVEFYLSPPERPRTPRYAPVLFALLLALALVLFGLLLGLALSAHPGCGNSPTPTSQPGPPIPHDYLRHPHTTEAHR